MKPEEFQNELDALLKKAATANSIQLYQIVGIMTCTTQDLMIDNILRSRAQKAQAQMAAMSDKIFKEKTEAN